MSRKDSDKEKLWNAAMTAYEPLKWNEFKCPSCGGVATVGTMLNTTTAECHACGLRVRKGAIRCPV